MTQPTQGEVWWCEMESGPRPGLVVTRTEAIPRLAAVLVAPVTRTIRGLPTEVVLGQDDGLPVDCVATFDNMVPIRKSVMTRLVGRLPESRRHEMCAALAALADC